MDKWDAWEARLKVKSVELRCDVLFLIKHQIFSESSLKIQKQRFLKIRKSNLSGSQKRSKFCDDKSTQWSGSSENTTNVFTAKTLTCRFH